jgi:inner membrane transporter RhtA
VAHSEAAARDAALARVPSPALVIGGIASVQFGSAIAATLFHRVGPAGVVLLRLFTGTLMLLALWRPSLHGLRRSTLWIPVVFGLVLGGMNLSFYESLHRIPLGIAVTLEFVGPLTVAILGSRRRVDLVWVALAAGGIVLLARGSTRGLDGLGVALALVAGGLWGAYIHLQALVGREFEGGSGLALAMPIATIAIAPVGLATSGHHLFTVHALLLGAAVGGLSSAIPYSLETEALRRIAPSVFGVLMSLEPAVAALAGWLVLGQGLSVRELLGMVLVVVASLGASRRAREAPLDG